MYGEHGGSKYRPGDYVRYQSGGGGRVGRIESVQYNHHGDATHYKIRQDSQPLAEYIPAANILGPYTDYRVCHCGADTVKSPHHATYCPKTTEAP